MRQGKRTVFRGELLVLATAAIDDRIGCVHFLGAPHAGDRVNHGASYQVQDGEIAHIRVLPKRSATDTISEVGAGVETCALELVDD